jgi:hypothetical protein
LVPRASTINGYGFVICRKTMEFGVSQCIFYL